MGSWGYNRTDRDFLAMTIFRTCRGPSCVDVGSCMLYPTQSPPAGEEPREQRLSAMVFSTFAFLILQYV